MGQHDAAMRQRAGQHRGLEPRDRRRGAGRDRHQHLRLRHHGEGLRLHVPLRSRSPGEPAGKVSALARDVSEFLAHFGYAPTRRSPGLTVAYHSACSLQHGQKVTAEPKALLQRPVSRWSNRRSRISAAAQRGTYNLLQPEIAGRLRDRKLDNCARPAPDLIAAGNIGCITQLGGGGIPVVHTVELLDWMAGGPGRRRAFN